MSRLSRWSVPVFALAGILGALPVVAPSADAVRISAIVYPNESGTQVVSADAGDRFTCAVLSGGRAKCWGNNAVGQLGQGDTQNRTAVDLNLGDKLRTIDVGGGRRVKSITTGTVHACALLDNGSVKCWGFGSEGQLGYGNTLSLGDNNGEMGSALPAVNLGTGRRAKALAAGNYHTCALLDNNTVKCWGLNSDGQLGQGDAFDRGDEPGEMGDALPAINLGTRRTARAIVADGFSTCALLDNGTAKCWGSNWSGQLGQGDVNSRGDGPGEMGNALPAINLGTGRRAKALTLGFAHACAVLDNGTVKCWGNSVLGQLGQGNTNSRGDGAGEMGNALPAINLGTGRRAKAITAGEYHTCVILDNNTVKCWGYNSYGQLGRGDTFNRGDDPGEMGDALAPLDLGTGRSARSISAGDHQNCVVLSDRTVACWGQGIYGQLGTGDGSDRGNDPGEMGDALIPVNLGVQVRSISTYATHACAILENRTLECWGRNSSGELGVGDTNNRGDSPDEMGIFHPMVLLGTGRTVRSLAVGMGAEHTCAILDTAQIKCWGKNNRGQLGLGDTNNRGDGLGEMGDALATVNLGTGRTARSVAVGVDFTCAVLDNGTVKCWGNNEFGKLGLGNTDSRGDGGGEMGDALPAVQLGSGRRATAVTVGALHACALLDNGTVKCWGYNAVGQLGIGDTVNRGDNAGEMGNVLPAVRLGTGRKARSISAGAFHTCALLDNGTVKCWGMNSDGSLGVGDKLPRGFELGGMGNALPAVDLGAGRKARAISTGVAFTCALLDNGTVKCWGQNISGQLGMGDVISRGDNDEELGNYLPAIAVGGSRRVLAVSAGGFSTCALLDDRSLRCWGENSDGQLGRGDSSDRGDGPNEMGLNLKPVALT